MVLDYGNQVSRTLQSDERSFESVVWNKGKPPLDSELNLMSEIQNEHFRRANINLQSGILDFRLAGFDELYKGTIDLVFPSAFLGSNEFIIQNFRAIVNGWIADVIDSSVEGGNFTQDGWISVEMPAPPAVGQRQDLLFLEVFRVLVRPNSTVNKPAIDKIYRYGNTQYRGTQLPDTMLDPAINVETTQRIQLQFRVRTVAGVNFNVFPEGVDDPTVKARGPNTGDTAYTFTNQGSVVEDYGLFRAGNGDTASRSVLGTVDGFIYAIPLLGVHRRNSTAYSVYTNPSGSSVSVGDGVKSDRPDGMFNDSIDLKDIMDLRHLSLNCECSLSEMVDLNLDQLLRGKNQNTWGNDYVGAQKGTKLLQVDGISVIDQPGIHDFAIPDGFRRMFTDKAINQSYAHNFVEGTNNTFSAPDITFAYIAGSHNITITATAPHTVPGANPLPILVWRATGNTVGLVAGWNITSPQIIWANINPADGNYIAGGTIDVVFYLTYEHVFGSAGSGMTHVPNTGYYVFNANIAQNERMGFSYIEFEKRTVGLFETALASFPVLGGNQDLIEDINPDSNHVNNFGTQKGTLRVYNGFMQGNGTASYGFPSSLAGFEIVGFYRFWNYTDPNNPVQIHPSNTTKTAGGFTIVFGQVFTTNQIIKFEAILRIKSLTIERHSKGVVESYQAETYSQAGTGSNTVFVTSPSKGIIVKVGVYEDLIGEKNYVYVNGIRKEATVNYGEGTGTVSIRIHGAVPGGSDTIIFEFVSTYAPVTGDRIQIYYEFDPYQGLGLDLDGAFIKKISEKGFAHTIGTGGDGWISVIPILNSQIGYTDIEIPAISPRLPLSGNWYDADLDLDDIGIVGSAIATGTKRLDLYESNKQTNALFSRSMTAPTSPSYFASTHPYEGQKLRVITPAGSSPTPVPKRGVSDAWTVDKGTGQLDGYFLQYLNPALDSPSPTYAQYVHWFLISLPPEDELYLVIWTDTKAGGAQGPGYSDYSQTGWTAYDVYRVRYRPLLNRR